MEWIAGTREVDNYHGIVMRRVDQHPRDALVALWPKEADTAEVASAIERLANQIRRVS